MSERLTDRDLVRFVEHGFGEGVRMMARELIDRRAADLTDFERLALRCLHDRLVTDDMIDRAALAALDKILGGAR